MFLSAHAAQYTDADQSKRAGKHNPNYITHGRWIFHEWACHNIVVTWSDIEQVEISCGRYRQPGLLSATRIVIGSLRLKLLQKQRAQDDRVTLRLISVEWRQPQLTFTVYVQCKGRDRHNQVVWTWGELQLEWVVPQSFSERDTSVL